MRAAMSFFALTTLVVSIVVSSFVPIVVSSAVAGSGHVVTSGPTAGDLPAAIPSSFTRSDTVRFGYYEMLGGTAYAIQGETWTFDHGAADPLEGWYAIDLSSDPGAWFRRITSADWSGHSNEVSAPILGGSASMWLGRHQDAADSLCWVAGLGYGDSWCQRVESPAIPRSGSGSVTIDFDYWSATEVDYDYLHVYLVREDGSRIALNGNGYTGELGDPANASYEHASYTVPAAQLGATASFRVLFELPTDYTFSDEDGGYSTEYGPFGFDDLIVAEDGGSNISFNFESGDQGFVASSCPGVGAQLGVAPRSAYTIAEAIGCTCGLAGQVLELHDGAHGHPVGQRVYAVSPIVDRGGLGAGYNEILAEWDQYMDLPVANGVFYRTGWSYYPHVCPWTGEIGWSPRLGDDAFQSGPAACGRKRDRASDWGVPGEAEQVRFIYEVFSSCDAFDIAPCTGKTNASPLLDNLNIGFTQSVVGPPITFPNGMRFQDAAGIDPILSTTNPGNADVAFDLTAGSGTPGRLGDSLVVAGPIPTFGSRWEARFWFRVRREGPGQAAIPGYDAWKIAVADGRNIVGAPGDFTFGRMDSVQAGSTVSRREFMSEFREDDDDFAGEGTNGNEMIRDGLLAPGTQIEYFASAAYISAPSAYYLLPDTTGGAFLEFEILPGFRSVDGADRFPALLLIDLDAGTQPHVEHALHALLTGGALTDPLPNPATWDRYDYQGAASSWSAPFARVAGRANGLPIEVMMGYRGVLVSSGGLAAPAMDTSDFALLADWLTRTDCSGNVVRQGLLLNGDDIAGIAESAAPGFLATYAGASRVCGSIADASCAPEITTACVALEPVVAPAFVADGDHVLYGNACPQRFEFDQLAPVNGGVGNRVYDDAFGSGGQKPYAQIAQSTIEAGASNHRTVLDGASWSHVAALTSCPDEVGDLPILTATRNDLEAALGWIFEGWIPTWMTDPCGPASEVDGDPVRSLGHTPFRILSCVPNPTAGAVLLNVEAPRAGSVTLELLDASGRRVAGAERWISSGLHPLEWDLATAEGRALGSGVYFLRAQGLGGPPEERRLVVLR